MGYFSVNPPQFPTPPNPNVDDDDDNGPSGNPSPFSYGNKDDSDDKKKTKKVGDGQGAVDQAGMKQPGDGTQVGDATGITKTDPTQAINPMQKINAVILRTVDSMRVSNTGSIEMNLKADSTLPTAFQGGTLTISTEGDTTLIRFDNVNVSQAELLLQGNPQAAQQLSNQLAVRGIQNAQIKLGDDVTITLPKAEVAPITAPTETQTGTQQDYTQRDGSGGQQGGGRDQGGDDQGPTG